jgi:hypothetical protein
MQKSSPISNTNKSNENKSDPVESMFIEKSNKVTDTVKSLLVKAVFCEKRGDYSSARKLFKKAATTGDFKALFQLMAFYLKLNEDQKVFNIANGLNEYATASILEDIGVLYVEAGDLKMARKYLEHTAKVQRELAIKLFDIAAKKKERCSNRNKLLYGISISKQGRILLSKANLLNNKIKELSNEFIESKKAESIELSEENDNENNEIMHSEEFVLRELKQIELDNLVKEKFFIMQQAKSRMDIGTQMEMEGRYGKSTENRNKNKDKYYWIQQANHFLGKSINNFNQLDPLKEEIDKPEYAEFYYKCAIIEENKIKKERYFLILLDLGYLDVADDLLRFYAENKKNEKLEKLLGNLFSVQQLQPITNLAAFYKDNGNHKKSIAIYKKLIQICTEQISFKDIPNQIDENNSKRLNFWQELHKSLAYSLNEVLDLEKSSKSSKSKKEKTINVIKKNPLQLFEEEDSITNLEKKAENGILSAIETLYRHYQKNKNSEGELKYKELLGDYFYRLSSNLRNNLQNRSAKIEYLKKALQYSVEKKEETDYREHIQSQIKILEDDQKKHLEKIELDKQNELARNLKKRKIKANESLLRKKKIAEEIQKNRSSTGVLGVAKGYKEDKELSNLDKLASLSYLIDQAPNISDKNNLTKLVSEIESIIINICDLEINNRYVKVNNFIKIEVDENIIHFYSALASIYSSRKNLKELKKILFRIEKMNSEKEDSSFLISTINDIKSKVEFYEREKMDPMARGDLFLDEQRYTEALDSYFLIMEKSDLLTLKRNFCKAIIWREGGQELLNGIAANNIKNIDSRCFESSFYAINYYYQNKKWKELLLEVEQFKKIVKLKEKTKNSKEKEKIEHFSKKVSQWSLYASFQIDGLLKIETNLRAVLKEKDPYSMAIFGDLFYHLKKENYEKINKIIPNDLSVKNYGLYLINEAVKKKESIAYLFFAKIKLNEGKKAEHRFRNYAKKCYIEAIKYSLISIKTNYKDSLYLLLEIYDQTQKYYPKLFSEFGENVLNLVEDEIFLNQILYWVRSFNTTGNNKKELEISLELMKNMDTFYKSTKALEIYCMYAEILLRKGEIEKARNYYELITKKGYEENSSKHYLLGLKNLAFIFMNHDKNVNSALEYYETIINLEGPLAIFKDVFYLHASYTWAVLNLNSNKINNKVMKCFQEVVKTKNYLQSPAYLYLALCCEKLEKKEDEEKYLQLAISSFDEKLLNEDFISEKDRKELKLTPIKAKELLKKRSGFKEFKEDLKKKTSEDLEADCTLVYNYLKNNNIYDEKKIKGAIAVCNEVLKKDSENIKVLTYKVYYYQKLGDKSQRVKTLKFIEWVLKARIEKGEKKLDKDLNNIKKQIQDAELDF